MITHDTLWLGPAWCGVARRGRAWLDPARQGVVGHGMANMDAGSAS